MLNKLYFLQTKASNNSIFYITAATFAVAGTVLMALNFASSSMQNEIDIYNRLIEIAKHVAQESHAVLKAAILKLEWMGYTQYSIMLEVQYIPANIGNLVLTENIKIADMAYNWVSRVYNPIVCAEHMSDFNLSLVSTWYGGVSTGTDLINADIAEYVTQNYSHKLTIISSIGGILLTCSLAMVIFAQAHNIKTFVNSFRLSDCFGLE